MNKEVILLSFMVMILISFGSGFLVQKTMNDLDKKPIRNQTLNIGMALIGTGQVNTINKITTTVLNSQHQGNMVSVSLANGYVTQLNDTQNQIKNGSVLELQVSESNPICYPVVSYKNGTVLPLISTITSNKYHFNQTSYNQNCDTNKPMEKIESWRIIS